MGDIGWNEPTGKTAFLILTQVTLIWKNNSSNYIEIILYVDQSRTVAKLLLEITRESHVRLSITVIRGHTAFYFSVAQQRNLGRGPLTFRFLDHTELHIDTAGRTPQLVAEASTYTTHIKLEGRISVLPAGFEPTIPAVIRLRQHEHRKRSMVL